MSNAAQAGLDAADHHANARIGFAATLRIHAHGAVGAFVRLGIRRVCVVRARFAIRGVAVDHRVHIASGDAEKQIRRAEFLKIVFAVPIRLADDADAKALRFQQAPDQRHAETRMVDVSVTRDQNDVARIPAECIHFRARGR